jgi:hypothetical protein
MGNLYRTSLCDCFKNRISISACNVNAINGRFGFGENVADMAAKGAARHLISDSFLFSLGGDVLACLGAYFAQ